MRSTQTRIVVNVKFVLIFRGEGGVRPDRMNRKKIEYFCFWLVSFGKWIQKYNMSYNIYDDQVSTLKQKEIKIRCKNYKKREVKKWMYNI